jgi:predicted transcriptional regulator
MGVMENVAVEHLETVRKEAKEARLGKIRNCLRVSIDEIKRYEEKLKDDDRW